MYRESHPEEHIELDETLEDLISAVHFLDIAVCAKEFVNFPSKFMVDPPAKRYVRYFHDRDNDRYDSCEDFDRDIENVCVGGGSSCEGYLNFVNLDDGVCKENSVEYSRIVWAGLIDKDHADKKGDLR